MKKIILTAVAVFALSFAYAQEKKETGFGYAKGDIVLGGNIKSSSLTQEINGISSKTSSLTIGPDVNYFITNNLALELGISLGNIKNADGKSGTTYTVLVGTRYYFLNLGERFKTYTNFGLKFVSDDNMGIGDNTTSLGAGAGIGINYFITSRIAIDFGLANIIDYKTTTKGANNSTSFDVDLNEFNNFFSKPTFGVSYKF
jgi:outer membrane protein